MSRTEDMSYIRKSIYDDDMQNLRLEIERKNSVIRNINYIPLQKMYRYLAGIIIRLKNMLYPVQLHRK